MPDKQFMSTATFVASFPSLLHLQLYDCLQYANTGRPKKSLHMIRSAAYFVDFRHKNLFLFSSTATEKLEN